MTDNEPEKKEEEEGAEAPEPTGEEPVKEESKPEPSNDEEYDAIIASESERKPDPVRAVIAKKERDAKKEVDEDEEKDQPLTESRLREILAETVGPDRTSEISKIARSLAKSDKEAAAIVATHANRQFPSDMSLSEQLEEVHAIVNRKINAARTQEVARALKSKDSVKTAAPGTHKDPVAATEPKMTPADIQGIKGAGYVWDGLKRVWKKPLPNKKFLYMKDIRSKSWIGD